MQQLATIYRGAHPSQKQQSLAKVIRVWNSMPLCCYHPMIRMFMFLPTLPVNKCVLFAIHRR